MRISACLSSCLPLFHCLMIVGENMCCNVTHNQDQSFPLAHSSFAQQSHDSILCSYLLLLPIIRLKSTIFSRQPFFFQKADPNIWSFLLIAAALTALFAQGKDNLGMASLDQPHGWERFQTSFQVQNTLSIDYVSNTVKMLLLNPRPIAIINKCSKKL